MPKGIGTKGLRTGQTFKLKSDDELLKESIYNILTTRKGERVGNPEFGTNLYRFLFQPHVEFYWEAIKLEIKKDIESQENRVILTDIYYIPDEEEHKLSIYVIFLSLITGNLNDLTIADVI